MRLKFLPVHRMAWARIKYLFLCILFWPTFVQVKWTYSWSAAFQTIQHIIRALAGFSAYGLYVFNFITGCFYFCCPSIKSSKSGKNRSLESLRAVLCRQHILQQPDENAVCSPYGPSVTWLPIQSHVSTWSGEHSWMKISTTPDLDHFGTAVHQANFFFISWIQVPCWQDTSQEKLCVV